MEIAVTEERTLARVLLQCQREVLELIAGGAPQEAVLNSLCRSIDSAFGSTFSSILLLADDGRTLRHGAAPNLPPPYCKLIDGITIGPSVGSCGTAAFTKTTVVVTDIQHDPLWIGYETIAAAYGLSACASTPIFAGVGHRLVGTFAIYHPATGGFSPAELELLRSLSDIAAIAILNGARERELAESETRLARATAVTGFMESVVALDGSFIRCANGVATLLGRTPEEMLTLRLRDVLHPDDLDADRHHYERLIRGDIDSVTLESRVRRTDGALAWVLVHGMSARGDDGRPLRLTLYFTEISEKKHTEDTLRASQKMESLGMLAPGLVHDFNNLLTAILCNASLAHATVPRDSMAARSLESIEVTGRRAADLSRQLLAYASALRIPKRTLDLNHLSREIAEILATSFLRRIRVEYELADALPFILADASQVHQVILNVVVNAAQSMDGNDVNTPRVVTLRTYPLDVSEEDIATRFSGQLLAPGEFTVVEVKDTGRGIPPWALAHMFDPFFTTKTEGRGLGLSVSLGILREHRAAVEVSSVVGEGTCVRLFFPVARSQATLLHPRPSDTLWPAVRGRALVVDRDEVVRSAVSKFFSARGVLVDEAADGEEALLALAKLSDEYEFLLIDESATSVGGRDAPTIIHERWPALRMILTAARDTAIVDEGDRSRFACVVRKPYNLADLLRVVFREQPDEQPSSIRDRQGSSDAA